MCKRDKDPMEFGKSKGYHRDSFCYMLRMYKTEQPEQEVKLTMVRETSFSKNNALLCFAV